MFPGLDPGALGAGEFAAILTTSAPAPRLAEDVEDRQMVIGFDRVMNMHVKADRVEGAALSAAVA